MSLDENVIHEYSALMADGCEFPPLLVVFDGAEYWLVDGFHRRWAAIKAKIEKLKCVVVEGTREDARWLSYSVNKDHGVPRSTEDKKKAVIAALKHPNGAKKSDRQIAEHVGVDNKTVAKYRGQLSATAEIPKSTERTGRDGRTINTANIGKGTGKAVAVEDNDELDTEDELPPQLPPEPPKAPSAPVQKEPTPFDYLKLWWSKANPTQKSLFRDWIDRNE